MFLRLWDDLRLCFNARCFDYGPEVGTSAMMDQPHRMDSVHYPCGLCTACEVSWVKPYTCGYHLLDK